MPIIRELARVFLCLATGEVLARTGWLPFPASVTGLVILFIDLTILGRVPPALDAFADTILGVLGLLFVPAGLGVLTFGHLFGVELMPVVAAVGLGTVVTIVVVLVTANWLAGVQDRAGQAVISGASDAAQ